MRGLRLLRNICDPKRPNFELFGGGFGAFVERDGISIIVTFGLSNETFD